MAKPSFVVPIADLESGEKHRRWEIPVEWLSSALANTEATPRAGPGELDVTLGLNGRDVMVRGRVRAALQMPCGRTLDAVDIDVNADVFLLLSPATPAGPTRRPRRRDRKPGDRARQPRPSPAEEERPLTAETAAQDTYDGEKVVLDEFVREFIVLDLPMVPLRSDLRSAETTSISAAPSGDHPAADGGLDPRLAPLAEIARRLRDKE
jgi:uncharacterized protein